MAIKQIHSVLKPGGVLLASVASCAPRFVEEERWRFTRPGLNTFFRICESGDNSRAVQRRECRSDHESALDTFVRYEKARWVYRRTACPLLNILVLRLKKAEADL